MLCSKNIHLSKGEKRVAQTTLPQTRWQEIEKIWKDNRWLYVVAGILIGIVSVPAIEQITGDLNNLIGNLVPETIGIIFTVLILNRAADNRAKQEIKQQLLEDLKSTSVSPAVNALDRLRRESWLEDNYFVEKDLQCANWEGAYIGGLNFEGVDLRKVNFRNVSSYDGNDYQYANFRNSNLLNAHLEGAYLVKAHMEGANLIKAHLQNASLIGANLENANLWMANLKGANLSAASLKGAYLRQVNLENVSWSSEYLPSTTLPDGRKWSKQEDVERFTNPEHDAYQATLEEVNAIRAEMGYNPTIKR